MASSSIVIKVRFGETLRRLNVSFNDKKLVLDMAMLKEKIRSLFSFGSDVEFTMTYVDEDGDTVTLADDDDLHDVVRQSLNPLRITVNLNSTNLNGPSGNLTPLRSPQNQLPFQTLNYGVSEILESVPEPLLEALAKLPLDMASKASSSAHVAAELVERMKAVYSNQILPSVASSRVHPTTDGPPNVNSESTVKNTKVQVNPEAEGSKKKEKQVQEVTGGVKFKDIQPPRGVDLNVPYYDYGSFQAPIRSTKSVAEGSTGKNRNTTDGVEKKKDSSSKKDAISSEYLSEPLKHDGLASSSFIGQINQMWQNQRTQMRQNQTNQLRRNLHHQKAAQKAQIVQVAADINKSTNDSSSSSGLGQGMLNATNQCPFSGMPLISNSDSQEHRLRSCSPHGKRCSLGNNGTGNIFHQGVICDGCGDHPITGPRFKSKVKDNFDLCNVCFVEMGNPTDYIRMDHTTNSPHWKRCSIDTNIMGNIFHQGVICDGCGDYPITGPWFKSKVKDDFDLCNVCFVELGNPTDYIRMDHPINSHHWKRCSIDTNVMGNIFHQGVICDGCGDHPITGPRFKSKVKDDFDLCNVCFVELGNPTDYIRMDHPTNSFSPHLTPFKGFYDSSLLVPPTRLDSRFILDVTVIDGTIMAPCTAFTKIWRMRNNGSIIWPYGSQLQWIGGDQLSFDVEIPVDGLSVDKEIDIAVDFTAPELPGRYVSYWRMASPSGQKFGERVWVLIQVDASMKNLGETSIDLNLPPVTSDLEAVNEDHLDDNVFSGNNIISDSENISVDLSPKTHETNFPINDSLFIDNSSVSDAMAVRSAPPGTASSSIFNPIEVGAALGSLSAGAMITSVLDDDEPINYPMVDDDQEQALMKDLEETGFKQLDLNKEILRMNNYGMEKSTDDLCGVLEWDQILDELHEMGFVDVETNRRLLKRNNGSIQGVVMDLINEENLIQELVS